VLEKKGCNTVTEREQKKGVCLIVGAGDGLGAGLARVFAQAGHLVCLVRRDEGSSAALVNEIQAAGGQAHAFSVDARDPEAVCSLFDQIENNLGAIDVAISNVGSALRAGVLATSAMQYRELWEANALSGILVGQNAVRVMLPRARGTVLFTGATASLRGGSGFSAFAAAKTALRAFAQSLAREFSAQGIHVAHVVIDGGIDSKRMRANQPDRVQAAGDQGLLMPDHIAQNYLMLHEQPRNAWSFELDLRPWAERW